MGVFVLQHTGSIKFLFKHKLLPWNNPTQTLWESQQNKLGILHPKRDILAGKNSSYPQIWGANSTCTSRASEPWGWDVPALLHLPRTLGSCQSEFPK